MRSKIMVSSRRVKIPLIVSRSSGFPERVKLNWLCDMFGDKVLALALNLP